MKTFIFIFYYVNIDGMSRSSAQNMFSSLIERTDLSKFNNDELEIVQQYLPITEGNSRVEFHHVPSNVIFDSNEQANKINKSIRQLNENIKNILPIKNIMDLYE